IRGAARDLAFGGIDEEGRDHEFALLEVRDRPQVDLVVMRVLKDRSDREADDRNGDDAADHGAEAERRAFEERAAGETVAGFRSSRRRFGGGLSTTRGRLGAEIAAPGVGRDVAHPEEAEQDRQRSPDRDGWPTDDKPDEDAHDADREADRP